MKEFNPMLGMVLSQISVLGDVAEEDDQTSPTPSQYALAPGDHVMIFAASALAYDDSAFGIVLDPEDYAEQFPDWEERLLKGYLLLHYVSNKDYEMGKQLGWFARMRCLKISEEQYLEFDNEKVRERGWPEQPEWMEEIVYPHMQEMHEMEPTSWPARVVCPGCGYTRVEIKAVITTVRRAIAGIVKPAERKGEDYYIVNGDKVETTDHVVTLVCPRCNAEATLDEEEYSSCGHMHGLG